MTMTGVLSSVLVKNCNGDASKANTCDIVAPLLGKVGTLAYQPVTFPIKAGDISGVPKVDVTLRAGLPASLETTKTTLKVTASNGDKLICVQIMTKSAGDSLVQSHPAGSSLPALGSVPEVKAAAKCTDTDKKTWDADAGHAQWQKQLTSCGFKCLGKQSCVTSCMQGDGWSSGCAGCFGALAQCTADHCMFKCAGGRSAGCVSCLKDAGCDTAAFGAGSCTGLDEPSMATEVAEVAGAGKLAVSFTDCGDASTDAVVKDVTPKTITAGSTTTITGSGSVKKDIAGGSYSMTMTGVLSSVLVKNCNGDASKANTCDIVAPLLGKVGTLAYQPVTFPIKAGDISGVPKVDVTLRAGLPASLETTKTTLKVTASNGDKLICVNIMTKSATTSSVIVV